MDTPIPIPIFAPDERPDECVAASGVGVEGLLVVGEEYVVVVEGLLVIGEECVAGVDAELVVEEYPGPTDPPIVVMLS
jgi:hypothetical protein